MKLSDLEKLKFKKYWKDAEDVLNILCDQEASTTENKHLEIILKSSLLKLKTLLKF